MNVIGIITLIIIGILFAGILGFVAAPLVLILGVVFVPAAIVYQATRY